MAAIETYKLHRTDDKMFVFILKMTLF